MIPKKTSFRYHLTGVTNASFIPIYAILLLCSFLVSGLIANVSYAATIDGYAFLDKNNNLQKDADELTLADHAITLVDKTLASTGAGGTYSAKTDPKGYFRFPANSIGNYELKMSIPSGTQLVTPTSAKTLMKPYPISISNSSQVVSVNFGFISTTTFTDPVWDMRNDSVIVSNSEYALRIKPDKNASQVTEMKVTQNGETYSGNNTAADVALAPYTPTSTTRAGERDGVESFKIAVGKNISPTGKETSLNAIENPNGSFTFTDPEVPSVAITRDADGLLTATDSSMPSLVTVIAPDGSMTVTDSESPTSIMVVGANGKTSVTDSEYPGMTATVNGDNSYNVTDQEFPELVAKVNQDGSYIVTDEAEGLTAHIDAEGNYKVTDKDGNCVDAQVARGWFSKKIKKFFHKVANFVSKVAGFVAKAARFIIKALPIISKVALVISKIAFALAPIFPPLCPFLCAVGKFALGVHTFIETKKPAITLFLEKVEKIANGVKGVADRVAMWTAPPPPVPPLPAPTPITLPPPPVLPNTPEGLIALNAINTAILASQIWQNGDQQTAETYFTQARQNAEQSGVPQAIIYVQQVEEMVKNPTVKSSRDMRSLLRDGERSCIVEPLAQLGSITAETGTQSVKLEWSIVGDLDLADFNVWRSELVDNQVGDAVKINLQPVSDSVEGRGGIFYTFEDKQVVAGHSYRYMVESISLANQTNVFKESSVDVTILPVVNNGIVFQDSQQTVVSTEEGTTVLPVSALELGDSVRVTVGSALTTDGQPSVISAEVKANGDVVLSDPQGNVEPLTVNKDGAIVLTEGSTQVTFDTAGGFVGTDINNPTQQVTMTPDGKVTATDSTAPDIVVTANADGSLTGKDIASGTEVTITKQGQQIVTHPEFEGMQAVVNPDGTLAVTDASDPDAANVAAIFNTQTGDYQVVNTADGTCYDENSNQRKSFWKKVAGFVSKAAGFIAKVANKVAPITNVIGKIAGVINNVASSIINKAPKFATWITLKWCRNGCSTLIQRLVDYLNGKNRVFPLLAKVQTVTNTITSVTNVVPKIAEIAQKVSGWFARWKSGRNLREGERATSTCGTWEPIPPTIEPPPAISYTLWGNLLNNSGNTLSGTIVKVGGLTATPDAQGYWEIKGLTEGEYEVTAEKVDLIFMPQTVELGSQEKVEVKFTPITDSKLKVSVNPRAPNQGDDIAYTVDIFNGSAQAMSATLKDLLPTGTLLNLTASEGVTCAANDATFECQIDTLAAGGKAQVSFIISNLNATPLTNKVTLTSPQFSTAATATTVTKIRPYLSASCKTKPSPAVMFGNLAYDCSVLLSEKAPDAEVTDVVFNLSLPKGIITTQLPATCTANDGIISCALGTLARGAPVKLDTIQASLGELMLLQLSTEIKVTGANYPETKDVVRTNILLGDAKVDGIILLDTTGSMQDEMDAMTQAVEKIGIKPDTYIALVSFRDDVKLEVLTSDRDELVKALKKLKADGGGECPEASAEALNLALDHIKPNGIIIFASDAPPYPGTDIEKLKARIVEKQANFVPILTKSDCAPNQLSHPQQ